ncbi:hypothetical protein FGG08_007396 [Glutinoglossum americanum]|uniref:Xylanolytic transcriptional activator regulatory domain-containing protein n=1 Tax=Glutinoglossum americanum TaxID=1670608 RepID=A0A9P8HUB1_9PEZI|nr:hypothetical protein FGG08_007396 [Glutinoglossum americanum]
MRPADNRLHRELNLVVTRVMGKIGWRARTGRGAGRRALGKQSKKMAHVKDVGQYRLEEIIQSHARILEGQVNNSSSPQSILSAHQETFISQSNGLSCHAPRPETALFLQKSTAFPTPGPNDGPRISDFGPGGALGSGSTITQGNGYQQHPPSEGLSQQDLSGISQGPQQFYSNPAPPLPSPSLNVSSSPQTTLNSPDHEFPPYDLLYSLVDLYFKHVNTWCPILHRRTTMDSLFGPSTLEEPDRILLHAIVATTLRFSTDSRLTEERRTQYHDISKQKVLLYGLENSSVRALQALVILALDLVGTSNGPPGWNLLALMARSVVQLGLSVESTSTTVAPKCLSIYTLRAMVLPEPKSFLEDECRRRLFWMIFLLDRYATIATAFEFALDEREIDRMLPCRDDLWAKDQYVETRWFRTTHRVDHALNRPENLGAFSYYVEILGILSRIHLFLKKPVDINALLDVEAWQTEYRELDQVLASWGMALPGEYSNMSRLLDTSGSKLANCGWVMLHATHQTTIIRLHSSAAYPATTSHIFTASYGAIQRCHSAVENIQALTRYVVKNGMLPKLGPPFAFTIWVASRLLLVRGSTIEHKVSPEIQFFVETLREMGKYWKVAERYSTILQRVLDEYRESERSMGVSGERVTPSSMKILADMRRCAYDLDLLISRQPKHQSRAVAVTPARTPTSNELEYLDVFEFFNLPRLPISIDGPFGPPGEPISNAPVNSRIGELQVSKTNSQFNTNFMVNADSDWLFKSSG